MSLRWGFFIVGMIIIIIMMELTRVSWLLPLLLRSVVVSSEGAEENAKPDY